MLSLLQTTQNLVIGHPVSRHLRPLILCTFADIAGANAAGWDSILVHTGVYDPVHGPPSHVPTHQAKDVEEAVRWAIQREMDRAAGPLP